MKITKSSLFIFGFVFCAVLLMTAQTKDEDPKGKVLFVETHKCNLCHDVISAKIEATTKSETMKGPDLSGYSSKYKFAELAAFVRKEADLDGESHKKPFKGTDEELQAIVDWLGSLEAKK
jgi:hypothetical protein